MFERHSDQGQAAAAGHKAGDEIVGRLQNVGDDFSERLRAFLEGKAAQPQPDSGEAAAPELPAEHDEAALAKPSKDDAVPEKTQRGRHFGAGLQGARKLGAASLSGAKQAGQAAVRQLDGGLRGAKQLATDSAARAAERRKEQDRFYYERKAAEAERERAMELEIWWEQLNGSSGFSQEDIKYERASGRPSPRRTPRRPGDPPRQFF